MEHMPIKQDQLNVKFVLLDLHVLILNKYPRSVVGDIIVVEELHCVLSVLQVTGKIRL